MCSSYWVGGEAELQMCEIQDLIRCGLTINGHSFICEGPCFFWCFTLKCWSIKRYKNHPSVVCWSLRLTGSSSISKFEERRTQLCCSIRLMQCNLRTCPPGTQVLAEVHCLSSSPLKLSELEINYLTIVVCVLELPVKGATDGGSAELLLPAQLTTRSQTAALAPLWRMCRQSIIRWRAIITDVIPPDVKEPVLREEMVGWESSCLTEAAELHQEPTLLLLFLQQLFVLESARPSAGSHIPSGNNNCNLWRNKLVL